jgi:hypothetical protein
MKILYIKRAYNTRLHNQVTGLAQQGHKLILLLEAPIEAGYNGPGQWNLSDIHPEVVVFYTWTIRSSHDLDKGKLSKFSIKPRFPHLWSKLIRLASQTSLGHRKTFLQTLERILTAHKVDIIISSNDALETEDMRTKWVIEAFKGKVPIVYECQDILSDCFVGLTKVLEIEKFVNEEADGVIHTNPTVLRWITGRYRIKKAAAFQNYTSSNYFWPRMPKLSEQDGSIHLVYCGSVQQTPKHYSYPFARDMKNMFREIASLGFVLHLHLGLYPGSPTYDYYRELEALPNIVLHRYLPFAAMMQTLTRYDIALFPVDLGSLKKDVELYGPDILDGFPLSRADTSKQYEYTMAGLPVLTAPIKWISNWLEKNDFGTSFRSIAHLDEILKGSRIDDFKSSVDKYAARFSIDKKIGEMEKFLLDVSG